MTVYLNEAYHPSSASSTASPAGHRRPGLHRSLAIALADRAQGFSNMSDSGIKIFAVVLTVGLTIYNYFGVKLGSILQNISMIAKLVRSRLFCSRRCSWARSRRIWASRPSCPTARSPSASC